MITTVYTWIKARLAGEDGQDLIEYALLGGLIAVGITAVILSGIFTDAIDVMATNIGDCIDFDDLPGSCSPGS